MAIYKFRVEIEDHEGIYREIEVKSIQTFEDLHYSLLRAFNFDIKHNAAFFYSDDLWHRDEEIAFKDVSFVINGDSVPMNRAKIADFIEDPHQRFVYYYDSEEGWNFLVELRSIGTTLPTGVVFPRLVKSEGEAPKQYIVKASFKPKVEDIAPLALDLDDEDEDVEVSIFDGLEVDEEDVKLNKGFSAPTDRLDDDADVDIEDEDADDFADQDDDYDDDK